MSFAYTGHIDQWSFSLDHITREITLEQGKCRFTVPITLDEAIFLQMDEFPVRVNDLAQVFSANWIVEEDADLGVSG